MLTALGRRRLELREKLGESLASIQKFDVPLPRATTPSLEALHAYALALDKGNANPRLEAIPHLKRAIELDPNFALALAHAVGRLRQHEPDGAGAGAVAPRVRAARSRERARALLHLVALLPRRHAGLGQRRSSWRRRGPRPTRAKRSPSTPSPSRIFPWASTRRPFNLCNRLFGSIPSFCRRIRTWPRRSWR